MRDKFYHEQLFRGADALKKLGQVRLTVCGAGAVGSNLIFNLARQGLKQITVIDFDRVESHNVGTQTYAESDTGMFKVEAVQADVFRTTSFEINAIRKKLDGKNIRKLLKNTDLVIDGFDNHASRSLVTAHCRDADIPCVHTGLAAEYAEVIWNETYLVPKDAEGEDVCEYPMARNLIQFAVAMACEAVVRFALTGKRESFSFTLKDMHITRHGEY